MKTYAQHIQDAIDAEAEERLVDALRCYRDALSLDATGEEALLGVARLSYTFGDIQEALEDYSGVLTRNPRCAEAYRGRAWCFFHIGRHTLALQDAHRAVVLAPAELENTFSRGQLQLELGLFEDAESDFQHVLHHQPDDADAALELACCLVELERPKSTHDASALEAILEFCARAREGLGEDGLIHLIEAEVCALQDDIAASARHLHSALSLDAELVNEVATRSHLHRVLAYLRAEQEGR